MHDWPVAAPLALASCSPAAGSPSGIPGIAAPAEAGASAVQAESETAAARASGARKKRILVMCWLPVRSLQAGKEGSAAGDVLPAEALRLRGHGRVVAGTALVVGECVDQVGFRLPADLGHVVVGVGVLVAGDAVAAHAGVAELVAAGGIAGAGSPVLGQCGRGNEGKRQGGGGDQRSHHSIRVLFLQAGGMAGRNATPSLGRIRPSIAFVHVRTHPPMQAARAPTVTFGGLGRFRTGDIPIYNTGTSRVPTFPIPFPTDRPMRQPALRS